MQAFDLVQQAMARDPENPIPPLAAAFFCQVGLV